MSLLEKPEPMTDGDFADGPDFMLWNPDLTAKRWCAELLRALTTYATVIRWAGGLIVLVLGIGIAEGLSGVLLVGSGAALLLSGLCEVAINLTCWTTDHNHPRGIACRLERTPDEFFFRSRDFADLGAPAHRAATELIQLTGELHATSIGSWLDPSLFGQVHQLAWDALCRLSRTRTARRHAAQLVTMPDEMGLAAAAAAAISEFDDAIAELIFQLQSCLTLAESWETKLRHAELVTRTEAALDELPAASILQVTRSAEELSRSVFAYVTAARDLTGAGPFPWETTDFRDRIAEEQSL